MLQQQKNPLVKPYLKWAGGKRQLLPEIIRQLPDDISSYTYFEPFIGAGAVFFDIQPEKAVINDSNSQLMLTYRVIKDNIDELIHALQKHAKRTSKEYYYEIRAQDRNTDLFRQLSDIEKAARVIFLNKTCYNGLYRVNARGFFNVPYGSYVHPAICEEPVLRAIHDYFSKSKITIMNGDFTLPLKAADTSTFVYFDPPYHSPDNMSFTGYQSGGFNENDQIHLADTYDKLSKAGVKCLLSNSDTEFIRSLYKNYNIISVKAKRAINSNAAGRGKVNEVLVKNW